MTFSIQAISQESQLNILLLDFEKTGGHSKYDGFKQKLPEQLKTDLKQCIKANIHVERFEEVRTEKNYFSMLPPDVKIIGFPTDNDLNLLIDSLKIPYNYILAGRYWEEWGIIKVQLRLIDCETRKLEFVTDAKEIESDDLKSVLEHLSSKLSKNIEMHLVGRIRIGLIDFEMTGGDSTFHFLEKSIPTMLATGLSTSRRFKLIETKTENLLIQKREFGKTGIFDPSTMLEIAKSINANYLIMGEYWEYGGKIRIDARCVSIETAEIILSEAIILNKVEIENISKKMNELASKVRITIEKDFLKRDEPVKSIAVVSFKPSPKNRRNKLITEHIRKALVRKLRLLDYLRVKEDPKKIKKYLKVKEDKLKICTDLAVNSLLTIQTESIEDEKMILDVDLYDIERPALELFSETKQLNYKELNTFVDKIIYKTLNCLKINQTDTAIIETIKIPALLTRWSFGTKYSFTYRTDNDVFFDKGGVGDYWEIFLDYHFNNRIQVEFFCGMDFGNRKNKGDNIKLYSYGTQQGVFIKYSLIKKLAFDYYIGLGGTSYQVIRGQEKDGKKDRDGIVGGGVLCASGLEIMFKKIGLSVYSESRYIYGTKVKKESSVYDIDFPGGRLGGLYLILGIGYHFNM
jgi:TolB-like protein